MKRSLFILPWCCGHRGFRPNGGKWGHRSVTYIHRIIAASLLWVVPGVAGAEEANPGIKHRFLAMDESRHAVLFIDETDPSRNWRIEFPSRYRDFQWIGNDRLLVSTNSGYAEYDLRSRQPAREVKDAQYAGSETIGRLENGHTVIGCNQKEKGIVFYELDSANKLLRTASFPKLNTLRLMRVSPRGTLLFGANGHVIEADMSGAVLRDILIPGARHIYQVVERLDRHLFVALGYGQALVELDPTGKEVRRLGGSPGPEGLGFHFFGGFDFLGNGHIIQCNWTGHGPQDSEKGVQLIEFDASGRIVWQWHHPEAAGSIHGVMVLDEAEPEKCLSPARTSIRKNPRAKS